MEDLFLFLLVTFNQLNLTFHMESLKGQFLIHCCLICICPHLGPSFSNTIFHITPMLMIHSYTYMFLPTTLTQWMASYNALQIWNIGWPHIFTHKWGQNRVYFSRSQGFEAPDSLFVNSPVSKTLWACQKLVVRFWMLILTSRSTYLISPRLCFIISEICLKLDASCNIQALKSWFVHLFLID